MSSIELNRKKVGGMNIVAVWEKGVGRNFRVYNDLSGSGYGSDNRFYMTEREALRAFKRRVSYHSKKR
jgi:hypothetical protein